MTFASRRAALAQRMKKNELITAPGVFELISAKIADGMGFECLYVTGYGLVASYLGLPDAGIATYSDMVNRVGQIGKMTTTPFIADADTGYGGLLNVQHTVRGYEEAGSCGAQLEDQEFPKKCGHMMGRRVIAAEDIVAKVKVAVASRSDSNFLVIARTDARTSHGLDEALRRAEAYLKAGADVLFVESPETPEEMRKICETFKGVPLLANMVHGGGRTPLLPHDELQKLGYRIAIYPAAGFLSTGAALERAFSELREKKPLTVPLYDFKKFSALMGFDWVADFDRKWRE
jgi:2-methylisocitrate lyase-like PEP mutase family enzyme